MASYCDINNRIEGHELLSDIEVSTDGINIPLDISMIQNFNKCNK
jgi:hypothetical protein